MFEIRNIYNFALMPFAAAIFLSAFLLFQVQPVIAKFILPWYGGSASVWSTCMLFFQGGLLAGYAYAHLITRLPKPRTQAILHFSLLCLAVFFLPITPDESLKPLGGENPVTGILFLLAKTVGIPYLLISATGPLLQKWFSYRYPGKSPYRLYALSNLGSLLGLLSYPFLIEPMLGLKQQSFSWSGGFILFVLVCGFAGWQIIRIVSLPAEETAIGDEAVSPTEGRKKNPSFLDIFNWILLSSAGSLFLLASTNKISQDVAVVPFLWIVPLSLYLISFIIAFDSPKWYDRRFWFPLFLICMPLMVYLLFQIEAEGKDISASWQIIVYCLGMFSACMILHGELARSRPAASHLTLYFLLISIGGAIGGIFVNFIVPIIFNGYWEIHTAILVSWILAGWALIRISSGQQGSTLKRTGAVVFLIFPLLLMGYFIQKNVNAVQEHSIAATRNFYGVITVEEDHKGEEFERRTLVHGAIKHGTQHRSPSYRTEPTTYYGRHSGIGIAIRKHPWRLRRDEFEITHTGGFKPLRVGMVGLGTGTVARYAKPDEVFVLYEINPSVIEYAKKYFSYLSDSQGKIELVTGDGRISMERELKNSGSRKFDVLAIDAFSGDAIPVHLLSREAIQLYFKHMEPDGILAIHITNRYINLKPVVSRLAKEVGKSALFIRQERDPDHFLSTADWILITSNQEFLSNERVTAYAREDWQDSLQEISWTDDYSAIFPLLKGD